MKTTYGQEGLRIVGKGYEVRWLLRQMVEHEGREARLADRLFPSIDTAGSSHRKGQGGTPNMKEGAGTSVSLIPSRGQYGSIQASMGERGQVLPFARNR